MVEGAGLPPDEGALGYTGNRISVRFEYEWHDAEGQWYRTHGNEHWEFDEDGLMRRRDMSANDVTIEKRERRISRLSAPCNPRSIQARAGLEAIKESEVLVLDLA